MSAQRIFFILGIVLLVSAVLLAIVSVYVFVSKDIRGVMDDLSGRTRGNTIRSLRSRGVVRGRGSVAKGEAAVVSKTMTDVVEPSAGAPKPEPVESNSAATVPEISFDIDDGNDDIPTVVTSIDQYHLDGYSFDASAVEPLQGEDPVTVVESIGSDAAPFRVAKRIILVHSDGVITAG